MKSKSLLHLCLLSLATIIPATATTLNVVASDSLTSGLYNYSYTFSVTSGTADNVYLGSADLSPLSVIILFDGTPTNAWSWLGNNSPQNYLQFFRVSGNALGSTDSLGVTFTSSLSPSQSNFAIALNSTTGDTSPALSGVLAPGSPTSVPEPTSVALILLSGTLLGTLLILRNRTKILQ